MPTNSVRINLLVKNTGHPEEIKEIVLKKVADVLNEWFTDGNKQPPYEHGDLLHWSVEDGGFV